MKNRVCYYDDYDDEREAEFNEALQGGMENNTTEESFADIFTAKQLAALDYDNPPKDEAEAVMRLYQAACAVPDLKGHKLVELMDKYHSGIATQVEEAKNILLLSVARMCINLCYHKYRTFYQKAPMDLVQSGCNGILLSLETYDPAKGSLTTWSRNYIIHELQSYVNQKMGLTPHYNACLKAINEVIARRAKKGLSWTVEDIAIETKIPAVTVKQCLTRVKYESSKQSLNDENNNIAETLAANCKTPEQECLENDEMQRIRDAVDEALSSEAERMVVKYAYGFEDGEPRSDKQIAEMLNISEVDVRKCKSIALKRIGKFISTSESYAGYGRKKKQVNQQPIAYIKDFTKFQNSVINEAAFIDDFDNEYFI